MNIKTKKLIAPIIITVLLICYFIFYICIGYFDEEVPKSMNIFLIVFAISMIVLSIYMLFERIKEIKDGEEDDLSKY